MKLFIPPCVLLRKTKGKRFYALRNMVFSTFSLLISCLFVNAKGVSSNGISLTMKNVSLDKVFTKLHDQTGYAFFYDLKEIKKAKLVTINVKDKTLEEVLDQCMKDQPLTYTIVSKTVVIKLKPAPALVLQTAELPELITAPPPINVSGRVVNENGEPVMVSVMIKGTSIGTSTNGDGYFELSGVDDNAILVITASNIETREVAVRGRSDLKIIDVKIKVAPMDEVQVIAYGTTTRRLSTGNITTVKAEDIAKQPVTNPLLALQGRVPGLVIEQQTGFANGGVKIRIQGQNSIFHGNEPLYVIDGAPYTAELLPDAFNGVIGQSNPLNFINPADIESVSVLKDADATSIYGSRAANGAILITTKKGKVGTTQFNLNVQNGWSEVSKFVKVLNTEQYLALRREAIANDGLTIGPSDYDLNGTWDQTKYTNWQKELLGGKANYQDYQASVSGGTVSTQFLISAGYHRETTIIPMASGSDFNDQKGNLHFNVNHTGLNQKFNIQLSGSYMRDVNKLPSAGVLAFATTLAPNAPDLYNADGTLNWAENSSGMPTWENPISNLEAINRSKTDNLVSNLLASYNVLKGLKVLARLSYNNTFENEFQCYPSTYFSPYNRQFIKPYASFRRGNTCSWSLEPQVTYSIGFGSNQFDLLAGGAFQQLKREQQVTSANDYSSDMQLENIGAAASSRSSSFFSQYNYNAIFGRLSYNHSGRYLANINVRRDGSSRFGSENMFNNFWSVSGGWIFSEENLFRNIKFLSFGKLTTSYGTTGNDGIGDYRFLNLYSFQQKPIPYQGVTGIWMNAPSNPYLQWEETRKLNISLDLGFLKDRILFTASYNRNRSSNQLLDYRLPSITGFMGILQNFPATLQNTGWEMALNTKNIETKDFTFSTALNITIPRNKLVEFPGLATSSYATSFIIGEPINLIRTYQYVGVNSQTGLYEVEDKDGKPTSNPIHFESPDGARFRIIDPNPKFYGGLTGTLTYKGWILDFTFQHTHQTIYLGVTRLGRFGAGRENGSTIVLGRWQKPGDITDIQKVSATYPSTESNPVNQAHTAGALSDLSYVDGSYTRLENASISWNMPNAWLERLHLKNCRLYLHGQNLLTISSYDGWDPENMGNSLPPLRVYTFGLQVGL